MSHSSANGRDGFITTQRGLDADHPALHLYEKAKRLGVWNPSDIDFAQDRADWAALAADERDLLTRLTSLFQAGEEAVTLDILPLIAVVAAEGRLEEELFLTTFLFEEGKHTDFFNRLLRHVMGVADDLSHLHSPVYREIFYEALPAAMGALASDASPAAQVRAAVTYNMIVEGVLAETGYHAYFTILDQRGIMPGVRQGVRLLKQDESRHIAYGVFFLSRLLATDTALWAPLETEMNRLLPPALALVGELFDLYDPVPFGLEESVFTDYALGQFQKRLARLEKARGASLADVFGVTRRVVAADDG